MPGASTAPRLTPEPQSQRISARAWTEPIVAVALGAALDGDGTPPVEPADLADLGALVARGPFDSRLLPPAGRHAHGPRALVAAIHHALKCAGVGDRLPGRAERAVVVGTSAAALSEVIHFLDEVGRVGAALVNPGLFPFTVMNAAAGIAAIELGCEGPNITLNHGPASALDAVAYAADLLAAGRARMVFAGGFEGLGPAAAAGLNRPDEPFIGAAVVALATAATAAELGLVPISRLVAGAGTDSAAGSPIVEVLTETIGRALEAVPGLAAPRVARPPADRADRALWALLGAAAHAGRGSSPAPLVAAAGDGGSATALLWSAPPESRGPAGR